MPLLGCPYTVLYTLSFLPVSTGNSSNSVDNGKVNADDSKVDINNINNNNNNNNTNNKIYNNDSDKNDKNDSEYNNDNNNTITTTTTTTTSGNTTIIIITTIATKNSLLNTTKVIHSPSSFTRLVYGTSAHWTDVRPNASWVSRKGNKKRGIDEM